MKKGTHWVPLIFMRVICVRAGFQHAVLAGYQ
jgi:hypothetical protein